MYRSRFEQRSAEEGFLLIQTVFALAIATLALFGALAVVPATMRLHEVSREHAEARNAAQARIAELQVIDLDSFRALFTPDEQTGGMSGEALLSFDVSRLPESGDDEPNGLVTLSPDPVEEQEAFQEATTFNVKVEVRWRSIGGQQVSRFAIRLSPKQDDLSTMVISELSGEEVL